jgi:hypothetical protein
VENSVGHTMQVIVFWPRFRASSIRPYTPPRLLVDTLAGSQNHAEVAAKLAVTPMLTRWIMRAGHAILQTYSFQLGLDQEIGFRMWSPSVPFPFPYWAGRPPR